LLEVRHFYLKFSFGLNYVAKSIFVPLFEVGLYGFELLLDYVHDVVAPYGGLSPPVLYILHE